MSTKSEFRSKDRRQSIDIFNVNQNDDLNKIKEDAIKQMEKLVDCTNKIHELEDINYFLQKENSSLLEELNDLKNELDERDLMENELQLQIADLSKKLAMLSIEKENKKIEEISNVQQNLDKVAKNMKENEILNQLRRYQNEIKGLRGKLNDQNNKIKTQREDMKLLTNELEKLKSYNLELESHSEMATDDRTKSQLLEIIRSQMEEKIHWETYAENLLRLILVKNPEILEISFIKTYCQISNSELVDIWNQHISNIINDLQILPKSKL